MRRTFRSELAARLGVSLPAVVIELAPSLGDARNVFRRWDPRRPPRRRARFVRPRLRM